MKSAKSVPNGDGLPRGHGHSGNSVSLTVALLSLRLLESCHFSWWTGKRQRGSDSGAECAYTSPHDLDGMQIQSQ